VRTTLGVRTAVVRATGDAAGSRLTGLAGRSEPRILSSWPGVQRSGLVTACASLSRWQRDRCPRPHRCRRSGAAAQPRRRSRRFQGRLGIAAVQELIGDTPVPGHLTTATQLASGATFDPRGAGALTADCEVAVTVGRDELAVALELVDLARQAGDVDAIITGNVLHLAFALGPTVTGPPGEARLIVNGEVGGEQLQPGDRIITGSVLQLPIGPGDHVVAEIDGLGRAEARIAGRATARGPPPA
jgi:2-keto-4-pentenoate hydratase